MSIVCVSIIGRDNDPLYFKTFQGPQTQSHKELFHYQQTPTTSKSLTFNENENNDNSPNPFNQQVEGLTLTLTHFTHTALDVIEEKVNGKRNGGGSNNLQSPANALTGGQTGQTGQTGSGGIGLGLGPGQGQGQGLGLGLGLGPGGASASGGKDFNEFYLGHLFTIDDYRIYGYITNTRIKLIVILSTNELGSTDANLKNWFREVHSLWVAFICSPFCPLTHLNSYIFQQALSQIKKGSIATSPKSSNTYSGSVSVSGSNSSSPNFSSSAALAVTQALDPFISKKVAAFNNQ